MNKTKILENTIPGLILILATVAFVAVLIGLSVINNTLMHLTESTTTSGTIEELRIETHDATIYIKNLHYEVDTRII